MQNKVYSYSASPHIRSKNSTKRIMLDMLIALTPATIMGIIYFGLNALLIVTLSLLSAFLSEIVFLLIKGKDLKSCLREFDLSSLVTGLLIGLVCGPQYPLYAPVLGSIFAIVVVKMLFGGTGKNLVNPAIVGRIFIFVSFQSVIGAYVLPSISALSSPSVTTNATFLEVFLKGNGAIHSNLDLFLGTGVAGCIGETCKVALILGFIYLIIRRIINFLYPVIYVAVTGLVSVALYSFDFSVFLPSILSGGLLLGAIFMATDYTTTPNTLLGNIIYFVLLGAVTAVLRYATQIEVVSFVILLMNLFVPLFDKFIIQRPFGKTRKKGE